METVLDMWCYSRSIEAKLEVELDTLTGPRDNPFKFKSGEIKTEESRKFDRSGKFKQDLEQYKEEDVKEALRKGSKISFVCGLLIELAVRNLNDFNLSLFREAYEDGHNNR